MRTIKNYAEGRWVTPEFDLQPLASAITSDVVAQASTSGLDFGAMTRFARETGGARLRALTFHERAKMLKALADALTARKEELYALSFDTGATQSDALIDIDGGIGTFAVYQSKARRELPNERFLVDGDIEQLSRGGTFQGLHVYTSRQGVAVHINAFNFPVLGMLEKLAPTLLAGLPAIVKPASATAWLTEAAVRIMIDANVLPEGALQFAAGPAGDLLDNLRDQDVLSFTGSAATAQKLRNHPTLVSEGVKFVAEQDSLNACVLGPDAHPDTPEFQLFVKEIAKELTTKAGQKCTAIRRVFAPADTLDAVQAALCARLSGIVVGDPRNEATRMGALVSLAQRDDVRAKVRDLARDGAIVFGDPDTPDAPGVDVMKGAYFSPVLLRCDQPWAAHSVHDVEAFGPVATLMPYVDGDDAVALVNRGKGSLVMSAFTYAPAFAEALVMGAASHHGRLAIIDRDSGKESTGHGSPMPHLVHGGPGRAGGGEELGGVRGVAHYMQRTALQGSPRVLGALIKRHVAGAPVTVAEKHPFRLRFNELDIGYQLKTASRTISLEDIEKFAHFTGDTFYAHMDEAAAAANPLFGGLVAHGYLVLAFAAGLFVDPDPGPVLANYGLDTLRFTKPVKPGDAISVALTVKEKSLKRPDQGEVRWDVAVTNQAGELVAVYDLLTMNAV